MAIFTNRISRNHYIYQLLLENHTLQECGDKAGVTRERVRQIKNEVLPSWTRATPPIYTNRPKPNALLRQTFWSQVDIQDEDKCWYWMGSAFSAQGYGRFAWRGHNFYAHRLSYMLYHTKALQRWALHTCNHTSCVNPLHLYDGTPQENANDRKDAKNG